MTFLKAVDTVEFETVEFENIHEAPPYVALQICKPCKLVRLESLSLPQTELLCRAGFLLKDLPAACGTAGELLPDKCRLCSTVQCTFA